MENIGSVIYTKTANGIEAKWAFSKKGKVSRGTGIGIRLSAIHPSNPFEGKYEISYTDSNGIQSPKLDLIIAFESDHYQLRWIVNGKATDVGIGIELDHKLCACWYEINP